MSKNIVINTLNGLANNKYISLTTFRNNGEGVPTPVMFAIENNKLYVETRASRYKVNRIKNNPKVQFAPCRLKGKVIGPVIEGRARVLPASEQEVAFNALRKRYFRFRLGDTISKIKSSNKKQDIDDRVYLEIIPEF
ncbi:MAG: PPOX class F420-dependent oxidoreductase [Promethearchaeota archaeon]